jgi:[acyl-carrier-protein] S-malonyltransferase
VEIGPGNTISKFVKKTAPDVKVYSIDSVKDYEAVLEALR